MRGSAYALAEIAIFVISAGLLGLLLGLLIRRPRPQSVRAAAAAGPERSEIERRLVAAVERSDGLESKLNAALAKVDSLSLENKKLEELRAADAAMRPDVESRVEERGAVIDRLESQLADRDRQLAGMERELSQASLRIALLEETAARQELGADDGGAAVPPAPLPPRGDFVAPRQNPTGPGAYADLLEFEVGGAD